MTEHCSACDKALGPVDAYCTGCGAAVSRSDRRDRAAVGPAVTATVRHEIIDRRWLYGLLALAVVALGAWGLTALAGGERAAGSADAASNEPTDENTGPEADTGSATSLEAAGFEPDESVTPVGPILDGDTGLSVLVTTGGENQLLDLDTGVVYDFPADGYPHAAIDDWVVLSTERASVAVPLSSPEGSWVDLGAGFDDQIRFWPAEDGRVWSGVSDGSTVDYSLLDLATGEEVDARSVPSSGWWLWRGDTGPHYSGSSAGGVWRWHDGAYEQVSSGQILAGNEELVLVVECETPVTCEYRWFDAVTWEERDLSAPLSAPRYGGTLVGDRILIYWNGRGDAVHDLYTGQPVQIFGPLFGGGPFGPGLDVSPDDRYLAVPNVEGQARIYDLDSDAAWDLEVIGAAQALLFMKTERLLGS